MDLSVVIIYHYCCVLKGSRFRQDVIALRKKTGTLKGDVLLNGFPQDPVSFRRCSGYVEQFDVQSPQLTVVETILFSARLRLDSSIVTDNHVVILNYVRKIMREMELSSISDALVGTDETGGLSFEEKKRLSIAVELAASPSVLFLDEVCNSLKRHTTTPFLRPLHAHLFQPTR